MFDLEEAIATWRRQVRAAGIQTPVPLDELENHLREEFAGEVQSGADPQAAFAIAVARFGPAAGLRTEFKNSEGFRGMIGADAVERTNRALGLLWLIYCLGSFYRTTIGLMASLPIVRLTPLLVFAWLMDFVYLRGMVASVLLFGGAVRERRFILFLAILDALGGAAFLLCNSFQPLSFAYTLLGLISIWLLWPWSKAKIATAESNV